MWEEEHDFEILEEVGEYDLSDNSNDDLLFPELDSTIDDENENSDVFEYEANFYYDEEDE